MAENKKINNQILKNLNTQDIFKYQKNRYPWFFIDYMEEIIPGESAKGSKCFSYNEFFYSKYYVGEPTIPTFIVGEVLEQVFLMTFLTLEKELVPTNTISSNVTYKRLLYPCEKLDVVAKLEFYRRGLAKGYSKGYVDNKEVCTGEFVVNVPSVMNEFMPKLNNKYEERIEAC